MKNRTRMNVIHEWGNSKSLNTQLLKLHKSCVCLACVRSNGAVELNRLKHPRKIKHFTLAAIKIEKARERERERTKRESAREWEKEKERERERANSTQRCYTNCVSHAASFIWFCSADLLASEYFLFHNILAKQRNWLENRCECVSVLHELVSECYPKVVL